MVSVFPSASVRQRTGVLQRQLLGSIPKKLKGLASFGLQALVWTPFVSCNANARMAAKQRVAAEMRMYRLLRHTPLAGLMLTGVQQLLPLNARSILNIDFSNFGGVAVLAAALQTNKGRALPWALETLVSNTQGLKQDHPGYARRKAAYQTWKQTTDGDQYDLVVRLVNHIDEAAGCQPSLVFDRGFGNKRILTALFNRTGYSYVRLRDDCQIMVLRPGVYGGRQHIRDLPEGSYCITWKGLTFRLVVATTGKPKENVQPWAIATNDPDSTPKQIARLYYHRFEIEETFRDWKSGLGLGKVRLQRWQSLQVLLAFASVATAFAWLAQQVGQVTIPVHCKKQLSFFRCWHEALHRTVGKDWIILQSG